MSKNAIRCSFSNTFAQGISPRMILVKIESPADGMGLFRRSRRALFGLGGLRRSGRLGRFAGRLRLLLASPTAARQRLAGVKRVAHGGAALARGLVRQLRARHIAFAYELKDRHGPAIAQPPIRRADNPRISAAAAAGLVA